MITSHSEQLPIEEYALLTENAPELRAKLDYWHNFHVPATAGEYEQIDIAVMASVRARRVYRCLTAMMNNQINTTFVDFDRDQEDIVNHYRAMIATEPGAAVVGLTWPALGVRFLIGRWERLLGLLQEEGTAYGNDRIEMINYQGARASKPEELYKSEGACLTWIYCLMCQPAPEDDQFRAMGNKARKPLSLQERPALEWLAEPELRKKLLVERAQGELTYLRAREEHLRVTLEMPARDSAEIRRQVLQGPVGARLLREAESHNRTYHRACTTFLKGREYSANTGRLPGQPIAELHGEARVSSAPVAPAESAEQDGVADAGCRGAGAGRGERHRAADRSGRPRAEGGAGHAAAGGRGGGGQRNVMAGDWGGSGLGKP